MAKYFQFTYWMTIITYSIQLASHIGSMSLCKISTEANDYYLCCTASEKVFDLVLTDCKDVWCGKVSEDDLNRMSRKLRLPLDGFVQDTRKALTRSNIGSLHFEYAVKQMQSNSEDVLFSWKKFVPSDNVRIQLGSVTLQCEDNAPEILQSIFDKTIESAATVDETINSLRSDNGRLSDERSAALKRLDKAVAAKVEMETNLYSKFVLVVNDKKRKLRNLKQEIDDLKLGIPSTANHEKYSVASTVKDDMRDSDGESNIKSDQNNSDYDTDNEVECKATTSQVPAKRSKTRERGAGEDSDLAFEGAEEISPVVTTTTRRRRERKGLKQTPSKPVIPKVPSSDSKKTPTPSSRPSLRRKASSKQSNSDPDFDDLLNAGFD